MADEHSAESMPEDIHLYDGHHSGPPDAGAALTTLFASSQGFPHLELSVDHASLGEAADAVAAAAAAAATAQPSTAENANGTEAGEAAPGVPIAEPATTSEHTAIPDNGAIGHTSPNTDANADPNVEPPPEQQQPPQKRKATSRANMLARGGACEFCKRRKLRCTAEQPKCQQCERSGRECVYAQKKQRSRVRLLEDRLQELEQRLDEDRANESSRSGSQQHPMGHHHSMALAHASAESVGSSGTGGGPPVFGTSNQSLAAPSSGVDMLFGLGDFGGGLPDQFFNKRSEPDLMTLADAAAADTDRTAAPWEGMTPRDIAAELAKAVLESHKGIGEKIMSHLMNAYAQPPHNRVLHHYVAPDVFFARIRGERGQPPHQSLIAAMIPCMMELSPSPTLNNRDVVAAVCDTMMGPSRNLAQHAWSSLDTRAVDLLMAAGLRSYILSMVGRFVDGYNEMFATGALVWMTGVGKLGGVAEAFLPPAQQSKDRPERMQRERRERNVRNKSVIVPLPVDIKETVDRIRVFWTVFLGDKHNAIGWNMSCGIDYKEVTTPLPLDSYDTPEALRDSTTLDDIMSGRVSITTNHSQVTHGILALTLLYEATRQLDMGPDRATHERTAHLLRLCKRLAAVMPRFAPTSVEEAIAGAELNGKWVLLHSAMMLLYAVEEIDAAQSGGTAGPSDAHTPDTPLSGSRIDEAEARERMIEAGMNVCACVQASLDAGDTELRGYDANGPAMWFITGRAFHYLAKRIAPTDPERAVELRRKTTFLVEATQKLSSHLKLAEVHAQMLYNVTLEAEVMLGEYLRPDNIDFLGAL